MRSIRRSVAVAATLITAAGLAACDPNVNNPTAAAPAITMAAPSPVTGRYGSGRGMTVFATSFMRGDTHDSGMWSVDCTPTRYLAHVEADDRWWPPTGIEVQVGPNGPDGPDGNWDQGRACPDGFILDTW